MMKTIITHYDIKHTGEELDRLEILEAFRELASLCAYTNAASVEVTSEKTDLICVKITTVESP